MNAFITFRQILNRTSNDIGLVQLRPKPFDEKSAFTGDFDFLGDVQTSQQLLHVIIQVVKEENGCCQFDLSNPSKVQIRLWDTRRKDNLLVDVWHEYRLSGPNGHLFGYLRYQDIQPRFIRRVAHVKLPYDLAAIMYINHLLDKQKNLGHPEVHDRLEYYATQCEGSEGLSLDVGFRPTLVRWLRALRDSDQHCLSEFVGLGNEELVREGLTIQKQSLQDDFPRRIRNALWRRIDSRVQRPFLAIVGPDGVGKSTVSNALLKVDDLGLEIYIFKHLFRLNKVYGRFLNYSRVYKNEIQNVGDEKLSWLWFWVAWIRFFREFKPESDRANKLIVFDRYFHDLLLQNVRSKTEPVKFDWLRRYWLWLFPLPEGVIQFYTPFSTLIKRKAEMREENVADYEHFAETIFVKREQMHYALVCTSVMSVKETVTYIEPFIRLVSRVLPR